MVVFHDRVPDMAVIKGHFRLGMEAIQASDLKVEKSEERHSGYVGINSL
jgi:hypothetical protein